MKPPPPQDLAIEDAKFLSTLTRETREHPERFSAGAEYLQARFTFEVIVKREKEKLDEDIREARRANERGLRLQRAHEICATRREMSKAGIRQSKINEEARSRSEAMKDQMMPMLRALIEEQKTGLSESERRHGPRSVPRDAAFEWARERDWTMPRVEAEAVCLVAILFYDNERKSNPALPPCLSAIPWAHPDDAESLDDVLEGRWLSSLNHGYDKRLLEAAHTAVARIAAGSSAADTESEAESKEGPPLSEQEWRFLLILVEQPPGLCLPSTRICELYDKKYVAGPTDGDFRTRIVPRLAKWGLKVDGRRGYYFPAGALARNAPKSGG